MFNLFSEKTVDITTRLMKFSGCITLAWFILYRSWEYVERDPNLIPIVLGGMCALVLVFLGIAMLCSCDAPADGPKESSDRPTENPNHAAVQEDSSSTPNLLYLARMRRLYEN